MHLWGKNWTRAELHKRIGALSQLGGITRFEYCDGKAKGVTALRVRTASGLEFTVLPEKGLDIFEAAYQGRSLAWHSPAGVVHPAYYDARNVQWLKTFAGGLLTTCGTANAGPPSEDRGEEFGLHGAHSNTPAEHVSWDEEWVDDELLLTIHGRMRESRVFGPNLVTLRTIQTTLSGRSLSVTDRVENRGSDAAPVMWIYHCNLGFPLLTDRSRIYCPSRQVEPRSEFAALHKESWSLFEPPTRGIEERVYLHEMVPDASGEVRVLLVSDETNRDFALEIAYKAESLPRFIEWKMSGERHFVLGLEPANCGLSGRKAEREAGTLVQLQPGESREFGLKMRVLAGETEVSSAIQQQSAFRL
jgi:hypothetical protein